jgi:hypothetical protein
MTVRSMFEDASEIEPRASQPSLKNADAVRQIPVTERVATLIRNFSTKYRNELGRIWNDVFDEHIDALKELESAW